MAELRPSPGARRKVAVGRLNLIVIKYNLYRKGLQRPGKDLSQVRKLIAMAAQLVSHLDSKDFKGSIYSGDKLDLAKKVKETLEQAKLGDKVYFSLKSTFVMFSPSALEIELNLLRPSWLGVLVARAMLQTSCCVFVFVFCDKLHCNRN